MKAFVWLLALTATLAIHPTLRAQGNIDIDNLTPQQKQVFERRLHQLGVDASYDTLSPAQRRDYYNRIREAQRSANGRQGSASNGQGGGAGSLPESASYGQGSANNKNPYIHTLTPIPELAGRTYQGVAGGLYPGGTNTRPQAHTEAGLRMAAAIRPLDTSGKPDDKRGKIVWLSIGMSNTTMESRAFIRLMEDFVERNPYLEFVDGAFGGQAIDQINDANAPYWRNIVEQRLRPTGLSPEQVQVVWFKLAQVRPTDTCFASYTRELTGKYLSALRIVRQKFPNARIAYLSPRIYGGYATTNLNPEPFAWYTGWACKLAIEAQIAAAPGTAFEGPNAVMPWLSWGPYLWANGLTPNSEGLVWQREDLISDGTHPSASGTAKVAEALLRCFSTDPTAKPWFMK